MTLAQFLLPWALLLQTQVHLCQEGTCVPHPRLQPPARVLRVLASEADCWQHSLRVAPTLHQLQRRREAPPQTRHIEARLTLTCIPQEDQ